MKILILLMHKNNIGPLYINKRHPENNYFRKITNMDHNQKNETKTRIHPTTQVLLRLKFIALVQK